VAGGWHKLFELNKDTVKDANLIYPGQHLRLR
jgi:nucleoid-associated protein YgaU